MKELENVGAAAKEDIDALVQRFKACLENRLAAIIIFGSVAHKRFVPGRSDIDLLGVVHPYPSTSQKNKMVASLTDMHSTFDIVVTSPDLLNLNKVPTPILFRIKMNQNIVEKEKGTIDFVLNRQDAYEAGVWLLPNSSVKITPVPHEVLKESVVEMLPYLATRFKNPILSLCRSVYTCQYGEMCSKVEAGVWALENLDRKWSFAIRDDLNRYQNGYEGFKDQNYSDRFSEFCKHFIKNIR